MSCHVVTISMMTGALWAPKINDIVDYDDNGDDDNDNDDDDDD